MFKNKPALCLLLGSLMVGCANAQNDEISAKSVSPPEAEVDTRPDVTDEPAIKIGPGVERLVDMAKQDLQQRMGVASDEIKVTKAEFVTWPDASMGCPQPGYQYAQVLTNGSRIHLSVGGKLYHYHSGGNRAPFLCETPAKVEPAPYSFGET